MPIYEWDCPGCAKPFESISKPHDPVICPHCGCAECARRFPLTAQHQWNGSTEGAMPKSKGAVTDKQMRKRERVTGMLDRQMAKIDGSSSSSQ